LPPHNGTAKRSEFAFDGFGRRVRVVEKDGATVTSDSRFVWDGLRLLESIHKGSLMSRSHPEKPSW
jgi:hypothetical protein